MQYCFSTATVVVRTRLNVTLYLQCLACYSFHICSKSQFRHCGHISTHLHTWICVETHIHTSPHTFTHIHTSPHISTHFHTYPHISTHLHTYPHIATHIHTSPHTSTHIHTLPQTFLHNEQFPVSSKLLQQPPAPNPVIPKMEAVSISETSEQAFPHCVKTQRKTVV